MPRRMRRTRRSSSRVTSRCFGSSADMSDPVMPSRRWPSTFLIALTTCARRFAALPVTRVLCALRKYMTSLPMPLPPSTSGYPQATIHVGRRALGEILVALERFLELVEVLDDQAGAARDAGERVLG